MQIVETLVAALSLEKHQGDSFDCWKNICKTICIYFFYVEVETQNKLVKIY